MVSNACGMMVTSSDDDDVDKLVITDECVSTTETLLLIRRRRMSSPFVTTRLQDATVQARVHLGLRPGSSSTNAPQCEHA